MVMCASSGEALAGRQWKMKRVGELQQRGHDAQRIETAGVRSCFSSWCWTAHQTREGASIFLPLGFSARRSCAVAGPPCTADTYPPAMHHASHAAKYNHATNQRKPHDCPPPSRRALRVCPTRITLVDYFAPPSQSHK